MKAGAVPGSKLPIKINRKTPTPSLPPFTDYFQGFENVAAVREVFGDKTEEVLSRLRIGFLSNRWMYMGIRDHDGNLAVGTYHLRNSDDHVLYLDIVHELFHIGQWMKDKEWFTQEHEKFMGNFELYWISPIEVPAYRHAVKEAERLQMPKAEIVEYLKMGPPTKVWRQFVKDLNLEKDGSKHAFAKAAKGLPVNIVRKPALSVHPFIKYFQGFEKMPGVQRVYGKKAPGALKKLKVEFIEAPFGSIFPSDDDGHIVVNAGWMKEATDRAVYLDILLAFAILKNMEKEGATERSQFGNSQGMRAAYKTMVEEARRLGAPDSEIMEHLMFAQFMMGEAAFSKLLKGLGLKAPAA